MKVFSRVILVFLCGTVLVAAPVQTNLAAGPCERVLSFFAATRGWLAKFLEPKPDAKLFILFAGAWTASLDKPPVFLFTEEASLKAYQAIHFLKLLSTEFRGVEDAVADESLKGIELISKAILIEWALSEMYSEGWMEVNSQKITAAGLSRREQRRSRDFVRIHLVGVRARWGRMYPGSSR